MLNKKLRAALEWHFYNYKADQKVYDEKILEVAESGINVNLSRVGSPSHVGCPTESKAAKLEIIDRERNWATVIRNTFLTFKFLPEHDIMVALYIEHTPRNVVIDKYFMSGQWERTFWRWREKWLECAYEWAREFGLL
jgi:hypothetical protein